MFRRTPIALLGALLLLLSSTADAGDPNRVWRTVESEHFIIHYYEPLESTARRVAAVAERAHDTLAPALRHSPSEKTIIVLTDDTDGSNGFAQVIPRNNIQLFATAPKSFGSLSNYDDWLYLLTAHEYTHILHLDSIGGFPALANKVVGKQWAPNQIQPRWLIEGIATYEESKRSSGGRTRFAQFDMEMRMATLTGDVRGLDQMNNGPRRWPGGNVSYMYGSHFLKYVFDTYGDDKLAKMSWDYGSNPVSWGLNRSARSATGKGFEPLFDEWEDYRRAKYGMQEEAVARAGRREGARMTFTGRINFKPKYTPDGTEIVWQRGDGVHEGQLGAMPVDSPGKARKYAVIDGGDEFDFLPDGSIIIERNRAFRTNYAFHELYHWDRSTGAHTQLTRGMRVADPDLSPDMQTVVFGKNSASQRVLATMPLSRDQPARTLWQGGRFDQALDPTWSPDGKTIAFSAWRQGGYRDLLLVDADTGVVTELSKSRAQDVQPVFSPDGRYLYFSSDRTGIQNIYAYELGTKKLWQVTNVLGGALYPDVSPDGKRLVYQGFAGNGYDLFQIDLDPSTFTDASIYVDDRPDPVVIRDDEAQVSKPRDYRPLASLAPRTYNLQLVTNSFGRSISASTDGASSVPMHRYTLAATVSLDEGNVNVAGSYSYSRFWPSLRATLARRAARRSGLVINGRNSAYLEEVSSLSLATSLPVLRRPRGNGTVTVSYDFDYFRNIGDPLGEPNPNDNVPILPETDAKNAGLRLAWSYNDTKRVTYGVGPQYGKAFNLSIGVNHPSLGGDFRGLSLGYGFSTAQRLPFGVSPVLALRVGGGLRTTNRARSGPFSLGGAPDQDVVTSIVNSIRTGPTGYLRGYAPGSVRGNQFHLANLEYRQELFNIDGGPGMLPIYLRRVHGALLFDVGNAFSDEFSPSDFKTSVGAALRFDTIIGYFVPGSFDIGYARGLSDGGQNEFWLLLTSTL